jgi:hyperpolarization activated cyclic nucleotide-gated potassium channel 2
VAPIAVWDGRQCRQAVQQIKYCLANVFALNAQIPFTVAFPEKSKWMDILVWIVDSIFFIDLIVVASTPVYILGVQCNDRWIIAKEYLKLYFWIDLIACMPFNR